jgi:hypothetical protein
LEGTHVIGAASAREIKLRIERMKKRITNDEEVSGMYDALL